MNIADIHFLYPLIIWIGIPLVMFFVYLFFRAENKNSIQTSAGNDIRAVFGIGLLGKFTRALLLIAIGVLFILCIAHPYKLASDIEISKDGIDIVLVVDVSGSMDFNDFPPSRMELAKQTLADFVSEISSDRVGLIVFAGRPISSQPLTFDYDIINETISVLSTDILNQNVRGISGTNIGDALLLAKSLFDKDEREKVIILLTDGEANNGADPALAAELLKKEDITIHAVGIGKSEPSEIVSDNGFFRQAQTIPPLNSTILRSVTDATGGVFFRASDPDTLKDIFEKLKELQTSEITTQVTQYKTDYFTPFVYALILLLCILSFIELIYPKCK